MQRYTIFHHMAGGLKGTVEANSEREALAIWAGIREDQVLTNEDGRAVVRYGMGGEVFHEYVAGFVGGALE